jgi:hypothetical protein
MAVVHYRKVMLAALRYQGVWQAEIRVDDEGLNLYADMAADGSFGNAERFAKKINTKFHDYSIFTNDGKNRIHTS